MSLPSIMIAVRNTKELILNLVWSTVTSHQVSNNTWFFIWKATNGIIQNYLYIQDLEWLLKKTITIANWSRSWWWIMNEVIWEDWIPTIVFSGSMAVLNSLYWFVNTSYLWLYYETLETPDLINELNLSGTSELFSVIYQLMNINYIAIDWEEYILTNSQWSYNTCSKYNPTTKIFELIAIPAFFTWTQWVNILTLWWNNFHWWVNRAIPFVSSQKYKAQSIWNDSIIYISWTTLVKSAFTTDFVTTTEITSTYFDEWLIENISSFTWSKIWATVHLTLVLADWSYKYYTWTEWAFTYQSEKHMLYSNWVSPMLVSKTVSWFTPDISYRPLIWKSITWTNNIVISNQLFRI